MGTVPQMGLGEFYRELRGSRLVKQKDVVSGDFTAAQLSRFESGKSMLAADKLITAVEGINMTMEEFTYKYHGYKEAPHIELANLISDLYYRQDRAGLEALLESDLLKAEGNLYARLNGIVIKVALAALDGQSDFDDEDREFLSDYLFAIEEWTSFELYLFLNAQMLLNDHMIVSLLSELKNKSKSYRNLRKHRDYLKKILTCYANRMNHYMFNVRGIVQSCTVALYHPQNVFGNINKGFINHDKLSQWVIEVDENCKSCPFVLICKSGHCPMAKRISKHPSEVLCRSIQRVVERNQALFALTKSYHDILDVG